MARALLPQWSDIRAPVIGMVHLLALPGSPLYGGNISAVADAARRDARALVEGGVHGLMMENFGDAPFYPWRVPAQVISHMTALAGALVRAFPDTPLGINVLRNDGRAALAIAHAVGACFIRVNVLCGARLTDQGIVSGIAHDLLRDRAQLGAEHVRLFADVQVKHSSPLGPAALEDEVADTIHRALADAVIVSGPGTGRQVDTSDLERVRAAAGDTPVLLGSGVTSDSLRAYGGLADGFIVGTSLKRDGLTNNPVDPQRVRKLVGKGDEGGTGRSDADKQTGHLKNRRAAHDN